MRNYLKSFFVDFDYEKCDADFLLAAYDKICANEKSDKIFKNCIKAYTENIDLNYGDDIVKPAEKAALLAGIHEYTADLLIFICLSKHLKELYEKRGIDLSIYHNSMLDLKYKLDECKLVRGICGTFVANWFDGFFNLTRFALGRLQFELTTFDHDYTSGDLTLDPDSIVINVHIPRSLTKLSKESCDASYEMAKEFFKKDVDPCVFVCSSWMLFPEHKDFLSPLSNTYRFMSEYDIIESSYTKNDKNLWRIFDTDEKNPSRLPTDSYLRKAYVEHLKNGGRTGVGFGVKLL